MFEVTIYLKILKNHNSTLSLGPSSTKYLSFIHHRIGILYFVPSQKLEILISDLFPIILTIICLLLKTYRGKPRQWNSEFIESICDRGIIEVILSVLSCVPTCTLLQPSYLWCCMLVGPVQHMTNDILCLNEQQESAMHGWTAHIGEMKIFENKTSSQVLSVWCGEVWARFAVCATVSSQARLCTLSHTAVASFKSCLYPIYISMVDQSCRTDLN